MDHRQFLLETLQLAQQRRGFCAPNPAVGAMVVREGTVLAAGQHDGPGHPHAEVIACQNLPNNLNDAVLYVSLEPCCHWGRTPPCTDLIIEKGIKTVFYGYSDPNPLVCGQGERKLQAHGVACQRIHLPEMDRFYQSYAHWTATREPWVTCKLAISLDGKIAGAAGHPIAITGPEAQKLTHEYRLHSDALLTSARTVLNDDPALNVRLTHPPVAKPVYVVDTTLSLPLTAQLIKTAAKITVFYTRGDRHKIALLQEQGVTCRWVSAEKPGLNLPQLLRSIGEDGVQDLWVEAGGKLCSALIQQQLVHKCLLYVAPKVLGLQAYPAFLEELDLLGQACKAIWRPIGRDVLCEIDLR